MLLDKEDRDKAEFIFGLETISSYRTRVASIKSRFLYIWAAWFFLLVVGALAFAKLSADYVLVMFFVSAMFLIWLANYINTYDSIKINEQLVELVDKQETEIESPLMNNYDELVRALSIDSQKQFLEALNTAEFRRVIETSVNLEHLPITLTMQGLQFVVASMDDLKRLKETLEKELTIEVKETSDA